MSGRMLGKRLARMIFSAHKKTPAEHRGLLIIQEKKSILLLGIRIGVFLTSILTSILINLVSLV